MESDQEYDAEIPKRLLVNIKQISNSQYLLSTSYVPNFVLRVLHALAYLSLTKPLQDGYCDCSHYIVKDTETQRCLLSCPKSYDLEVVESKQIPTFCF